MFYDKLYNNKTVEATIERLYSERDLSIIDISPFRSLVKTMNLEIYGTMNILSKIELDSLAYMLYKLPEKIDE